MWLGIYTCSVSDRHLHQAASRVIVVDSPRRYEPKGILVEHCTVRNLLDHIVTMTHHHNWCSFQTPTSPSGAHMEGQSVKCYLFRGPSTTTLREDQLVGRTGTPTSFDRDPCVSTTHQQRQQAAVSPSPWLCSTVHFSWQH